MECICTARPAALTVWITTASCRAQLPDGSFEHANAISGVTMSNTILVDRGTCFSCNVACAGEVEDAGKAKISAQIRRDGI